MAKLNVLTSKTNWTYPLELIDRIKALAEKKHLKPSQLVVQIFHDYLDRHESID